MDANEPKISRDNSERCTQEQRMAANESIPIFAGLKTPWEEFHRSQSERISRIAVKLRVPRDRIPDVVQEVWLDALKNQEKFQGEDVDQRLVSWLSKVVRSKSINAVRRLQRRWAESLDTQPVEPADFAAKEPTEMTKADERVECLSASVEELRKAEPRNFWLVWERKVNGRSIRELASETGLGVNAISSRVSRTLKKLRGQLEKEGFAIDAAGQSGTRERR